MHTSKLTKCLTLVFIFHYHLVSWCNLQIHAIGVPSDLNVSVYTDCKARMSTQGQLQITHTDFAILISHVTVVHIRFIKSTYFYVVKQKN